MCYLWLWIGHHSAASPGSPAPDNAREPPNSCAGAAPSPSTSRDSLGRGPGPGTNPTPRSYGRWPGCSTESPVARVQVHAPHVGAIARKPPKENKQVRLNWLQLPRRAVRRGCPADVRTMRAVRAPLLKQARSGGRSKARARPADVPSKRGDVAAPSCRGWPTRRNVTGRSERCSRRTVSIRCQAPTSRASACRDPPSGSPPGCTARSNRWRRSTGGCWR